MLARAREAIEDQRVTWLEADITKLALEPSTAVMLNFVLQFVAPEVRLDLLERIRGCLEDGGILLLSEKIRDDDPADNLFHDAAHLDFKRANGYSALEISQKRAALEEVMIVDHESAHLERLKAAGFSRVTLWYRCLNWISLAAFP